MDNSKVKDHFISVLTETVETQKDVIEHLERCLDYSNDRNFELKKKNKAVWSALYFNASVLVFMTCVFIYHLTM